MERHGYHNVDVGIVGRMGKLGTKPESEAVGKTPHTAIFEVVHKVAIAAVVDVKIECTAVYNGDNARKTVGNWIGNAVNEASKRNVPSATIAHQNLTSLHCPTANGTDLGKEERENVARNIA